MVARDDREPRNTVGMAVAPCRCGTLLYIPNHTRTNAGGTISADAVFNTAGPYVRVKCGAAATCLAALIPPPTVEVIAVPRFSALWQRVRSLRRRGLAASAFLWTSGLVREGRVKWPWRCRLSHADRSGLPLFSPMPERKILAAFMMPRVCSAARLMGTGPRQLRDQS